MAFSISPISRLRGRPPGLATRNQGFYVMSVSYAGRIIWESPIDPFTLQPSFQTGYKIFVLYFLTLQSAVYCYAYLDFSGSENLF